MAEYDEYAVEEKAEVGASIDGEVITNNQEEGKEDKTKRVFTSNFLKCILTDDEREDLATRMADKVHEVDDIELQKKVATASFKDRTESAQQEIKTCAGKLRNGWEMRNVECEEFKDFTSGYVIVVRLDTGETVTTRPISHEERQMHIDEAFTGNEQEEDEGSE